MAFIESSSNLRGHLANHLAHSTLSVTSVMDPYDLWSHTVPNQMPWASSSSPKPEKHEQPQSHSVTFNPNFGVIQFTGGTPISSDIRPPDPCSSQTASQWELLHKIPLSTCQFTRPFYRLKRRNSSSEEDDDDNQPPAKQYISEEKFTAQFNQMKITNVCSPKSNKKTDDPSIDEEIIDLDQDEDCHGARLYMSQEMKQALERPNDAFNRIWTEECDKAAKAIVLWQPPIGLLSPELASLRSNDEIEEEQSRTNQTFLADNEFEADIDFTNAGEIMDV